jgi:ABC-2 type transport system permease protein
MNSSDAPLGSGADVSAALGDEGDTRANGVAAASRRPVLVTLIRRELWEHRALWIAPLLVAVLLIGSAFLATIHLPGQEAHDGHASGHINLQIYGALQWVTALPQLLVMVIVLNFYLLDCLYAERKDRSILFWKSLPVGDGITVASKLLVALLVVPVGVFLLSALSNLLIVGILNLRAVLRPLSDTITQWDTLMWIKQEAMILVILLMSVLWYAPAAAYLALLSAWARRTVVLWAVLPPLLLLYLEWYAFATHHIYRFLEYRTVGIWQIMHLGTAIESAATLRTPANSVLAGDFGSLRLWPALTNIDLWLGLAAAIGLAWLTARMRRFRDDT